MKKKIVFLILLVFLKSNYFCLFFYFYLLVCSIKKVNRKSFLSCVIFFKMGYGNNKVVDPNAADGQNTHVDSRNASNSISIDVSSFPTVQTIHVNHGEKPEKFNGVDFMRWQQKMLFYLTTLNLCEVF